MTGRPDIAISLADAARTIDTAPSIDDALAAITRAARVSLPRFEHIGISTIDHRGRVTTRAATSEVVKGLDDLQYTLTEGPCVDTLRDQDVVLAPDIRHDGRWPTFTAQAVASYDLRSQMAVKLFLDEEGTLGCLNLYSTSTREIDPEDEHVAEVFAAHAAVALGHAREVDQLRQALQSSRTIGTAIGIVMERYHLDRERAFEFLTRASSHANLKLRDVAARIVESTEGGDADRP